MATKYPIEYTLSTTQPKAGKSWITVTLQNVGTSPLSQINVQLNSLDTYHLTVYTTGSYIEMLNPGEKISLPFQILATGGARVYLSVDGTQDKQAFSWESPSTFLRAEQQPAELESLFVMTKPYLLIGEKIECEATVGGLLDEGVSLRLEFWAEKPTQIFEPFGETMTKALAAGEIGYYKAEMIPDEEGLYTIYAYLYDGIRRIDKKTATLFAKAIL